MGVPLAVHFCKTVAIFASLIYLVHKAKRFSCHKRSVVKFKLSIVETSTPHMLERNKRYEVLINGEKLEKITGRSGEIYYNMTGYRGAIPTVDGTFIDPGERPISAFRKIVSEQNTLAKAAIIEQEEDKVKVRHLTDSLDPRYHVIILTDGQALYARKSHVAMFEGGLIGAGDSLVRRFSTPEVPTVKSYEIRDAIRDILRQQKKMNAPLLPETSSIKEAYPDEIDIGKLLRVHTELSMNAIESISSRLVLRWIAEEKAKNEIGMIVDLDDLQASNFLDDPRFADLPAAAPARAANDLAEEAVTSIREGAEDRLDKVRAAAEAFEALPDGMPRDVGALESLMLRIDAATPDLEDDSMEP